MGGPLLVTGATGLLGREVVETLRLDGHDVIGTGLTRSDEPSIIHLDLVDENAIERVLNDVKPRAVINCAAIRSPVVCADHPSTARAINATAPAALAAHTARRGVFLLHISTDYVFSGAPGNAPYRPSDDPDPLNAYGRTKRDGERGVLQAASPGSDRPLALVLRVPLLYGHAGSTRPGELMADPSASAVHALVAKAWEAQKEGVASRVDDHAVRYPTAAEDVAHVVGELVELYTTTPTTSSGKLPQVLHFSAKEAMTKFRMAEVLAEILGMPLGGIEPAGSDGGEEGSGDGIDRPYDCHLDSSDLERLGISMSTMKFEAWWRRELGAFRK